MKSVREEPRETPVVEEADLCVLGGSCTGVFAAIRAARLGLRVIIVERMGCFGGVATLSLVNVWHSPLEEGFGRPILGGLTLEIVERLKRRNSVIEREKFEWWRWAFNPFEMQIELDEMIVEAGVKPMLHTSFVSPYLRDEQLKGVIVENKSGRQAILARFFIDATGDGDLCDRLKLPTYVPHHAQPATTCAIFGGWESLKGFDLGAARTQHGAEFGLSEGFGWGCDLPENAGYMFAGTRVTQSNCLHSEALTHAEIEGRRQVRALHDLIRRHAPGQQVSLRALPSRIGIRETRHIRAHHQVTGQEVLRGVRFTDAIANGSYPVDIHHQDKPGVTWRFLDGREIYFRPGAAYEESRWRPLSKENPGFYQIPYRSLIPQGPFPNLLAAGRFIDADPEAHAAIRVMVNMNQTGEAAGVAAALALQHGIAAAGVHSEELRGLLADGGSIML